MRAPHVYEHTDVPPDLPLWKWRQQQDAARREQAKRTKARVLASLLRR